MPRGGRRLNTPKPSWNAGKTTTVRIPIALKDDVLKLVRALDELEVKGTVVDENTLQTTLHILKESLTLPANKGGAIKEKIREVIALLETRE